jgi:hypothetical protein
MDGSIGIVERDAKGRFAPGCSGNPAGKRPGTRNRATLLAAALEEGEGEAMARIVIDKALAGDATAARFCIDRLCPRPRGRAISLELPEGLSPGGMVVAAFNAALRAMAAGEITPEEAVTVARFLEGRMKALKACQLERRMAFRPIPGDDAAQEFSSPLGERMGEGEPPPAPCSTSRHGTAPSPNLSPRGEEKPRGEDKISPSSRGSGERVGMRGLAPANPLHSACIGAGAGQVTEAAVRAHIEAQIAAIRARSHASA